MIHWPRFTLLLLVLVFPFRVAAHWSDGPWRQTVGDPSNQVNGEALQILGLAASSSRIVAVGERGLLRYSDAPEIWRNASGPTVGDLNAAIWINGQFIAVGDNGGMVVSASGDRWETKPFPGREHLLSISEGDGMTLVTDVAGGAWVSTDREQWTRTVVRPGAVVSSAARGKGLWVVTTFAVENGSVIGRIYSSPDGRAWTERQSAGDALYAVRFANGRFVIVGEKFPSGLGSLWLSGDGITWSIGLLSGGTGTYRAIALLGSQWVLVGGGATLVSSDGVSWTQRDPFNFSHPSGMNATVAFKNQVVTAAAYMWLSSDLLTWSQPKSAAPFGTYRRVAWGDAGYVAVGDAGATAVSEDGLNWTAVPLDTSLNVSDVAYGAGVYVAAAYRRLYVSHDGRNWRGKEVETLREFHSVRYLRGRFFAIAGEPSYYGSIWSSLDGNEWTECTPPGANRGFYDIADSGAMLLVGGFNGLCTTSSDGGITWTPPRIATFYTLSRIVGLGGRFIALTDSRVPDIVTSVDGQSWSEEQAVPLSLAERATPNDLVKVGPEVAIAYFGTLGISADGHTWRQVAVDQVTAPAYSYAHGNGTGVLVGGRQIAIGPGPQRAQIMTQPLGVGLALNSSTTLSVSSADASGVAVQWYKDGQRLPGQNATSLTVTPHAAPDYGRFYAELTKDGVVTSSWPAAVTPPPPPERLLNASVRSEAGTGENSLIAGFVLSGTQPETVLLRAVGPGLRAFGVSTPLADPQLAFYRQGEGLWFESGPWQQQPASTTSDVAAGRVGAFRLAADSLDAATVVTLPPGAYSVQAKSATGAGGNALVEVYALGLGSSRLANLSTRAAIDPARGPLIVGFVVTGAGPQRVLLRGIGPGLQQFGLGGVAPNPRLTVFDASNREVASNDDWTAPADTIAASVGAFPLPAGSRDAAISVVLPPGAYSVHVSSDVKGVALAEVYLVTVQGQK